MSNPPKSWLGSTGYNKFSGSYFNNDVDCSGGDIISRTGNLYLASGSSIYSPSNRIFFNEQYAYVNFSNNVHIYGVLQQDYLGTTYNVGTSLYNVSKISYDGTTTTFLGAISFPSSSIASTAINNSSFVGLVGTQTVAGVKTFSSAPSMSGASISASSIPTSAISLTAGSIPLTAISIGSSSIPVSAINIGISSIASTAISNTSFVDLSSAQTIAGVKTFSNAPSMSGASITSGSIPLSALVSSGFVDLSTAQTIAGVKTFSNAPSMSGASISASSIPTSAISLSAGSIPLAAISIGASSIPISAINIGASSIASTAISNTSFVDLSSAQSVGGIKTFTSAPVMSGASITSNSIPSGSINNTSFVDVTSISQTIGANVTKIWQSAQTFSNNIRLDGSLIVNLGSTAITNATLRNLANITSDVQLQFGACAKLTANTFTGIQTFSGNLIANSLTITPTVLGYLSGVTSNIQTQINNISTVGFMDLISTQTASGLKTFSSLLTASAGISTTTIIQTIASTGGGFTLNQPNGCLCTIGSGTVTGGLATEYQENIKLTSVGYGVKIEGGFKSGTATTDQFNIIYAGSGASAISGISTGTPSTSVVNVTGILQINNTDILATLSSYQPIGTIIQNISTGVASPYLLCDGRLISRTSFSALFALIGTTYSAGDGSTTFGIPNFQGMFLRGAGTQTQNSVAYTAAALGTFQADSLQDHSHSGQAGTYTGTTTTSGTNGLNPASITKNNQFSFSTTGVINSGRASTETRPANFAVYYYIRAI